MQALRKLIKAAIKAFERVGRVLSYDVERQSRQGSKEDSLEDRTPTLVRSGSFKFVPPRAGYRLGSFPHDAFARTQNKFCH
jgi:hypothetical protein